MCVLPRTVNGEGKQREEARNLASHVLAVFFADEAKNCIIKVS